MDEIRKKQFEDVVKYEFPGLIQMLERTMDLRRWGFQQTFAGICTQFPPSVIYDSESCRIRFMWHIPDIRDRYKKISVVYGRLHAPVDESIILWKGERCYCWHSIELALNFLDKLSPQDIKGKSKLPRIMESFYQPSFKDTLTDLNIKPEDIQPELMARMHAAVWQHYGQSLFNLFDLRYSELWDRYRLFIREYYRLNPEMVKSSPSLDKVC